MTRIEWTEATWNPIVGCSVVSPGCTNCYAMRVAHRLGQNDRTPHYAGLTQQHRGGPVWTGKLALAPEHVLTAPLRRQKPTTYFVNSMGDLFHESVPDDWINRVFAVMALAPQHRFQVLTKRAARMREYMDRACGRIADAVQPMRTDNNRVVGPLPHLEPGQRWWPLPNVWLGVSAEDQTRADERIPDLLATSAAVRFVSAEPLLGPVDLRNRPFVRDGLGTGRGIMDVLTGTFETAAMTPGCLATVGVWMQPDTRKIDWVICGGESGPDARPMHPDWARSLRDQCQAAGAAFFFKQHGEYAPYDFDADPGRHDWMILDTNGGLDMPDDRLPDELAGEVAVRKVGKARAGRLLDGREWNELPEVPDA